MLTKTIGLTIRDYKIAMTSPLKFFEEDDLELIFTVGEFGAKVVNDEQDSEVYTPMFPEDAILFVETPRKVDTVEAVLIDGENIHFRLTNKYSHGGNIGIGRMQIVLFDGDNRKALPPFQFEIQPIIYQEQPEIMYNGLMDEYGVSLCSEDMMLLDSTDPVYGIKISELPITDVAQGYIPIVQDFVTKKISVDTLINETLNQVDNKINDSNNNILQIVDSKIINKINTTVPSMINEQITTQVPTLIDESIQSFEQNIDDKINQGVIEGMKYTNPISETITNYKTALDYLLYYDLSISLYCNQSTNLEVGESLNSITFTWNYNKDGISFQSFNGENIHDLSIREYTYNIPLSTNKTFTLMASDERKTFSKSISFNFKYGRYWGVNTNETLDSSDILSLNKELSNGRGKTFTVFSGEGLYIYYCYPISWGAATFSVGGFVGGFELVGTVAFTNSKGNTSDYYVYRSSNHSLGNTTVTVS